MIGKTIKFSWGWSITNDINNIDSKIHEGIILVEFLEKGTTYYMVDCGGDLHKVKPEHIKKIYE